MYRAVRDMPMTGSNETAVLVQPAATMQPIAMKHRAAAAQITNHHTPTHTSKTGGQAKTRSFANESAQQILFVYDLRLGA